MHSSGKQTIGKRAFVVEMTSEGNAESRLYRRGGEGWNLVREVREASQWELVQKPEEQAVQTPGGRVLQAEEHQVARPEDKSRRE